MEPTDPKVIRYIRALGNGDIKGNPEHGLCDMVYYEFKIPSRKLRPYFPAWPGFSGDLHHPITTTQGHIIDLAGFQFKYYKDDLWGNHEYGDLRREFCRWLADHLEAVN